MTGEKDDETRAEAAPAPAGEPRRLKSEDLFVGAREVLIAHNGQDYRLRITALGRLILTK
jgi:hemin uptake protein HemP